MRRLCDKLLSSLNISGRDLAVFLLSLLLAFSIWLIHNLSLKYNAYLDVPIKACCNIEGHSAVSSNKEDVVARCRATGYNVIRSGIRKNSKVVEVTFNPSSLRQKEDDLFYIISSDLQEYSHLIFGDGVTVEYFASDTLFFKFPKEITKRVPVIPVNTISYKPQYINEGPFQVSPDSVNVYADSHILDHIEAVYTKPVRYSHLSSGVKGEVALEPLEGVRLSEDKVRFSLDVTRYVELVGTFPVNVTNVPADKKMSVYPSKVNVFIKSIFPVMGNPLEEVVLKVDYNEFNNSVSGKCVVHMFNRSDDIIDYDVYPPVVECVVEEAR